MFSSNTSQVSSGGYEIQRSLRFNSADSAYLNRTPASAGNRQTWTWSGWVKRSVIAFEQDLFGVRIDGDNQFRFYITSGDKLDAYNQISGSIGARLVTTQVFRDPSAWYHLVLVADTTNATAGNRLRMYVNGSEITAFDTDTQPSQNYDTQVNRANAHSIGYFGTGFSWLNGYMTEVNFIDGQALTPSSFGAFDAQTGVWGPTRYAGSYGTNGFYLNFSDNSNTTAATLGKDYSGNSNNWTPNNFSVSAGAGNDSLVDVPTNWGTDTGVGGSVRGNYCTLNPLDSAITLSNGNLDYASDGSGITKATIGVSSGKWYWECVWRGTTIGSLFGIASESTPPSTAYLGQTATTWSYYINGVKYNNGSSSSYGASYTTNDVIGVALDMDAGTLVFYKNGVSQGTAASGLTGVYFPAAGNDNVADFGTFNFGQRPFAYTAPSGFKALNTQNLPTPTIGATTATQAGKFFNTVTYTGTGANLSVTGVGFQPDWVWTKERDAAYNHGLFDSVRGATKGLVSNTTAGEYIATDSLTAFNSDGFSLGTAAGENISGGLYVAWNWKANGAGVTNTAGSITSTVSANTTSGFSVVTWTGTGANATVGHGLGSAPRMMIVKSRNTSATGWMVYHSALSDPPSQYMLLNTADAVAGAATPWNATAPTSSVISVGTAGFTNASGSTYVAYCFSEIPGYSKFGRYTGNGSADGPFVFCGFRPAYVMIKNTTQNGGWMLWDDMRSPTNVADDLLYANLSNAETTYTGLDLTANGFKIRNTSSDFNWSGDTYIFAAFAEAPQKFALAR